jgi:hypothetical protein
LITSGLRGELDEQWAAVADSTRRRLLDVLLARREATTTTLAGALPSRGKRSPSTWPCSTARGCANRERLSTKKAIDTSNNGRPET